MLGFMLVILGAAVAAALAGAGSAVGTGIAGQAASEASSFSRRSRERRGSTVSWACS